MTKRNLIHIPVDALIPAAVNARTHTDEQVAQIARSISEFGFTNPVLLGGSLGIVAGHGRVLAARKLALQEVPCIRLDGLSVDQLRAYALADNKLALNAGWDDGLLRAEIEALQAGGFDVSLTGFNPEELAAIVAEMTTGETDPDAEIEPPKDPTSVLGDVWVLGNHRIACGSSTEIGVVEKALGGSKPHLMVTDPPYGVEYDADWRNQALRKDGSPIGGRAVGKVLNDGVSDWREAWALFNGDVAYVWHAGLFAGGVGDSLTACGFKLRSQIIWAKSTFAIGRGDYHWHHEPCWYAVKDGATGHYNGSRKETTLWQIDKPQKSESGHSTQKPIECVKRPIENNSVPGDAVYEPFSGSGTTIIACEMTGRHCRAIELNPAYVDMAVIRWEKFTGKKAVHAETGKPFKE